MDRPNIVYLHSHDTGRYVQPYGFAVDTPNIQRLAEEGVLFRQAFCASPTCSPSRASLLTGTWPHCNGMVGLAHRGSRLNDYNQHLASVLRQQGYTTALSGMQHEIADNQRQMLGYEHLLDLAPEPGMDQDEVSARRAAEFLSQDRPKPFFLSCGFFLTHRRGSGMQWFNGQRSPAGDSRYVRPPLPLPDVPQTRQDFADFAVAATRLDDCMGVVLDALERSGQARNTLVICTTDHGIAFPLMKCNLTDHGIGVMLIVRGPGGFEGGQVIDALVSHLDLFPTICEVANLSAPPWLEGTSLAPLARGQANAVREEVFAEVNYHVAYEPTRAVRTSRYKYIGRFDPRSHPILCNCDDSISKNIMLDYGWGSIAQRQEYLFDLALDPHEACNRVDDANYAGILADMRCRLDRWMRQTNDPLLGGPVKPWPKMVVNDVQSQSPQEPTTPARG